jgi:universal stress protein A
MSQARTTSRAKRTLPFRRILVPVDFSAGAALALDYAVEFAAAAGASLHLLHVAEISTAADGLASADFPAVERRLCETAERELARLVRERVAGRAPATVEVRPGWPFGGKRPHAEIVEAARKLDADLIVIGTHGRTGFDHLIIGSTAERVVRHAQCPVLTVRAPGPD